MPLWALACGVNVVGAGLLPDPEGGLFFTSSSGSIGRVASELTSSCPLLGVGSYEAEF